MLMPIPLEKPQSHKHRRACTPSAATVSDEARTQPLSVPQGENTAASYHPRATKSVDRQIWKPNPGAATARPAAPTPRISPGDHATREHTTVGRALDTTTATLATQRTRRARIAFHASLPPPRRDLHCPNPIPTAVHTPTSLTRRPQRPQLNLFGLDGALRICTSLIFLGTGRVPGQPRLARPPVPQDHNPEDDTPRTPDMDTPQRI